MKNLQRKHKDVLGPSPSQTEKLFPRVWIPKRSFPDTRTDIPGLSTQRNLSPISQKILTLEMIQQHGPKTSYIYAYTDGSAENAVKNGRSGINIRYPDSISLSNSVPVGLLSSNYRAEAQALIVATEHLLAKRSTKPEHRVPYQLTVHPSISDVRTNTVQPSMQLLENLEHCGIAVDTCSC